MVFTPKIVHTWFVSKNIIENVINITRGPQIGGLDPEKLEGAVRKLISYILLNPSPRRNGVSEIECDCT